MEPEPGSPVFLLSLFVPLLTLPSVEVFLGIIAIIVLLIGSALISGSEVAFFSLTHNDNERLDEENATLSKAIHNLKATPRYLLATILISNNFINIAIVILSDFVLTKTLPPEFFANWSSWLENSTFLGLWFDQDWLGRIINFLITVVGVTFLLVLFGEVAPKVYAKINNVRLALFMARPLALLKRLFAIPSSILVRWTSWIETRLERSTQVAGLTSREDIDDAIELTIEQGIEMEEEADILRGIVKFGDVAVKQIMRSRVDVIAIDFSISYKEVLEVVRAHPFSRIPVYNEDFDSITGILYVKDLLGHLYEEESFEWQELIRTDLLYVPEAKKIDDLLREFQRKRLHMAIVVDEYGGSSGIVTLEDIMEEIIGEIKDEFDVRQEVVYKKIDDYNYLFEGKTLLNDVCRIIGLDTNTFDDVKGEADSLAGLILEYLGDLPEPEVVVDYNDFRFKIVSADNRRIKQVMITLPN